MTRFVITTLPDEATAADIVHQLVAEKTDMTPLLVLDDVLSELDPDRCTALLTHLPQGQVVITTASALPEAARPDRVLRIEGGAIVTDQS